MVIHSQVFFFFSTFSSDVFFNNVKHMLFLHYRILNITLYIIFFSISHSPTKCLLEKKKHWIKGNGSRSVKMQLVSGFWPTKMSPLQISVEDFVSQLDHICLRLQSVGRISCQISSFFLVLAWYQALTRSSCLRRFPIFLKNAAYDVAEIITAVNWVSIRSRRTGSVNHCQTQEWLIIPHWILWYAVCQLM